MLERPSEEAFATHREFLAELIRYERPIEDILKRDLLGYYWHFDPEDSDDVISIGTWIAALRRSFKPSIKSWLPFSMDLLGFIFDRVDF